MSWATKRPGALAIPTTTLRVPTNPGPCSSTRVSTRPPSTPSSEATPRRCSGSRGRLVARRQGDLMTSKDPVGDKTLVHRGELDVLTDAGIAADPFGSWDRF